MANVVKSQNLYLLTTALAVPIFCEEVFLPLRRTLQTRLKQPTTDFRLRDTPDFSGHKKFRRWPRSKALAQCMNFQLLLAPPLNASCEVAWNLSNTLSLAADSDSCPINIQVSVTIMSASLTASSGNLVFEMG